mmetsp:Transcript_27365/g.81731  ORF Transcript_27365/g.81731 Transcript_27365/m.81731 type:complete len:281 (+) Transcript_27365:1068-1910(+)
MRAAASRGPICGACGAAPFDVAVVQRVAAARRVLLFRQRRVRVAGKHGVGLLHIDVRPHVVRQRGGQRVEGEGLEPVNERRVAEHREGLLERRHRLDHSARLCSAVGRAAAEHLVGAEEGVGLALVLVQPREDERHRRVRLALRSAEPPVHRRPSESTLRVVDAVVVRVPAGDGAGGEADGAGAVVVAPPVHALGAEEARGAHQQLGRAGGAERQHRPRAGKLRHDVVHHVQADLDKGGPARRRPLVDRVGLQQPRLRGQVRHHGRRNRRARGWLTLRVH